MKRAKTLLFLVFSLLSHGARAQDVDQREAGLTLAKRFCAECHAVEKATVSSPNAAAPRFEVIANTPGMAATALAAGLRTPHRTAPNLILGSDELRNVTAYILSLKKGAN